MSENGKNKVKIKKISRTFVKDEAYNLLAQRIINGELKPCERLRVQELSDDLGISRTPVREALLQLESEGLVMTKANRWTIVAPINPCEAKDIYPIIYSLEELALIEAFDKIDEKFIEKIQDINEDISYFHRKKDQLKTIKKDNEFHDAFIELSGNAEIKPIIDKLKRRVERMEIYFFETGDENFTTYKEHMNIINALKEKNLDKARKFLVENWKSTIHTINKLSKDLEFENIEDQIK
ncbi:MAG: GntR family transcriptional regulator [Anaerococcus vaginalis]|uniref:GntR family transcriptional regulator n=1 Tax=Anaerococcus vaginalis TaxID=33037 RepID=UPI00290D72D0|nr:GntR family transcriptional regulator [Anaerococcus vaginalis]MDU4378910.1 GntR family transcriptional regulator [Anaerococcus vaginalis]